MNVEDYKIMSGADFNPALLDPGIRRVVVWLRSLGYRTTDSGDGVSKPEEARVMGDRPHVFMVVPKSTFFADVDRLSAAVDAFGIECGEWDQDADPYPPGIVIVQGQYSGLCTITVTGLHEGNFPAGLGL